MKPELLLKVSRSNLTEREHYGFVVLVDKSGVVSSVGDYNARFFLRSCAKPFQALPIINSGAFERFGFTLQELAVCCASHTGTEEHTKLVKSIMSKIGLGEEFLHCGTHDPLDIDTRKYFIKSDIHSSPVHNNCSGKHAGMLSVCVHKGYDVKTYLDFSHPLQVKIREIIENFSGVDNLDTSIDGCSAPIYGMPLYRMGVGFLNLFLSDDAKLIKEAYTNHPTLMGGNGRLDTEIIRASQGSLISKVGAEGLCIIVNLEKRQALVVKILDSNMQARGIVTIEALKNLGWVGRDFLNAEGITKVYDTDVKTINGVNVGTIKPVFEI